MTFSGFPQEGLDFLANLADNNNKPWFEANKPTYKNMVEAPALDFVTEVGQRLQAIAPGVQYDRRTNGGGSLMRIYRDTRFSKDKSPYKTNVSGLFWQGARKNNSPAFGFQMTHDSIGLMAGLFGFDKEKLAMYRAAVDDEKMGSRLADIVANFEADPGYELMGDKYKRVPREYDSEHVRGELLKYKGLYAHPTRIAAGVLTSPSLVDETLAHFERMAPLYHWMVDVF